MMDNVDTVAGAVAGADIILLLKFRFKCRVIFRVSTVKVF